jgi:hypothetical protein
MVKATISLRDPANVQIQQPNLGPICLGRHRMASAKDMHVDT